MTRFVLTAAVAVAATSLAAAQGRQPGTGAGRANVSIIPQVASNKDLQADLKVTDAQKEKFKDSAAKLADVQKKMADLRPAGGGRPDQAKMTEVRAEQTKVNEEVTKVVNEALTAEQKKRVKQIEVQAMSLRAFANEDVLKELKLTDEQKTKVKEITDATQKELTDAGLGRPMGRPQQGTARPDAAALAEQAKKRAEINGKATEKVSALLTDDQKKAWKELTGEKFDTTKLATGFGGGRGMRNDQ